jgi:hypothetical protein
VWREIGAVDSTSLARRLAQGLDGDPIETPRGWYVRRELRPVYLPLNRDRLAGLPRMPPPTAPLLCLDTETTGLGTAAGTVAFLIGLARWEDDRLRPLQLALPDHSEEGALLEALRAETPRNAWLVTYNGRSFDWPLLETRFRTHACKPWSATFVGATERRTSRPRRFRPSTTPSCEGGPLDLSGWWPATTPRT